MKKNCLFLILTILFCIASTGWSTQIPSTINYQGVLSDDEGNLVADGDYDMTFSIYDKMNSGTALWTETWSGPNAVSVINGRFNVTLGALNSFESAGLDFTVQYFLEVQLASEDPFFPRLAFNSVPYAMSAKNIYGKSFPDGDLVGTNDIQTLTGKTLTEPTIEGGSIDGVEIGSDISASGNFTTLSASGDLTVDGQILGRATVDGTEKTTDYTLTETDDIILVDTSAEAVTVTLPSAAEDAGRKYTVKLNTAGNDLTIEPTGAEQINGGANLMLEEVGQSVQLVSDGTGWQAVGEVGNVCIKRDTSDLGTELDNSGSDSMLLNDLIVSGSECIGMDCVNGEAFSYDTLILKENNLRIYFNDTSTSASFPRNDWRITVNDSANGGRSYFSIDDVDGGTSGLLIEAGGNIGLGSPLAPQGKLDVTTNFNGSGTVSTVPTNGTGTISSTGTMVTGVNTLFTTELVSGGSITAQSETKPISYIMDDTTLVVESAWSSDLSNVGFTYPGAGLSGNDTSFTTQLKVGDTITASGKTKRITGIANDSELEVDSSWGTGFNSVTYKYGSTDFLVTGAGGVGVGTASPDEKFEVEFGDSSKDVEIGQGSTDTDVTFITLRSPNGTKFYITVNDSGTLSASTTKP
jgi:hypothetical protein